MSQDLAAQIHRLQTTLGKMEVALGVINEAIVWTGEDTKIQWCNTAFEHLVNRPRIAILGTCLTEVLPLAQHNQTISLETHPVLRVLENQLQATEYELPQGQQTLILEISGSCIELVEEGKIAVLVIREITERKQAQETLQRSEAKYRNLFENSQVGIFRTRLEDGLILDANQRFVEIAGFDTAAQTIGSQKTVDFYVDPSDRQRAVNILQTNGEVHNFEAQFRRQDGSVFWGLFSARLNPTESCMEGIMTDISELKQVEAALQTSEAELRALVTAMTDVIIVYDRDGRCRKIASTSPTDQLIKPADEQIHQTVYENLPKPVAALQHQAILHVLETGQTLHDVEYSLTIDDQERWFSTNISLLSNDTVLWVARDISDRKQADVALQQAVESAEVANRAKSQFLSNMSHELRTPLNIILGFTQLMVRNSSLPLKQQEYLDTISRSGEHLLNLINDVLEMSKIEAGRITLNETDFDLHRLLTELRQMLQFKAEAKGLQLLFDWAPDLPQYICADEGKLRQILMNLLGNAIKFTSLGRVSLCVRVRDEDGERSRNDVKSAFPAPSSHFPISLSFEVEDTGPGITPDELEHLFDPFIQAEAGRNSNEGTGLGLPISQQFVRLMGGEITVSTKVQTGTIFRFDVQAFLVNPEEIQIRKSKGTIVRLEDDQPRYRILIAEDRPENRQILVELLVPVGFEVREATNGQEAIALWKTWSPHLIWMDMRMPVLDGYEATKQIKAQASEAPVVIALTGSAFEEDRLVALSIGCDDFVRKPVQADVIFEKMAEQLGVRYIYSSRLQKETDEFLVLPDQLMSQQEKLRSAIQSMSNEWIGELHQAAIKLSSKQVLNLIQQIPERNSYLTTVLLNLANDFRFEDITALICPDRKNSDNLDGG